MKWLLTVPVVLAGAAGVVLAGAAHRWPIPGVTVVHETVQDPRSPSQYETQPDAAPPAGVRAGDPDPGSTVDLEGDEVTPAVATYAVDGQGRLFEVHAPHTDVLHLSAPVG